MLPGLLAAFKYYGYFLSGSPAWTTKCQTRFRVPIWDQGTSDSVWRSQIIILTKILGCDQLWIGTRPRDCWRWRIRPKTIQGEADVKLKTWMSCTLALAPPCREGCCVWEHELVFPHHKMSFFSQAFTFLHPSYFFLMRFACFSAITFTKLLPLQQRSGAAQAQDIIDPSSDSLIGSFLYILFGLFVCFYVIPCSFKLKPGYSHLCEA